VGYFLYSSGRRENWPLKYLKTEKVANVNEFFVFLRELNIWEFCRFYSYCKSWSNDLSLMFINSVNVVIVRGIK